MKHAMQSKITGSGSPLVLVPGGLTGWISWDPFVPELAKNHKVIQVQLLNVELGLEDKPLPPGYTLSTECTALANTLRELNIDKADFAAWSYGALTTLDFSLNHPEKVRSVTLIEPPAIWVLRGRGLFSKELEEQEKLTEAFNAPQISEEQLAWFTHFAGFVPDGIDPRSLPQWPVWLKHRQSLRSNPQSFKHHDTIDRLRQLDIPALLVTGEGTSPFLADIIKILSEELPNVRVEHYPGGHAPHIAAKDEFLARLNLFLQNQQ